MRGKKTRRHFAWLSRTRIKAICGGNTKLRFQGPSIWDPPRVAAADLLRIAEFRRVRACRFCRESRTSPGTQPCAKGVSGRRDAGCSTATHVHVRPPHPGSAGARCFRARNPDLIDLIQGRVLTALDVGSASSTKPRCAPRLAHPKIASSGARKLRNVRPHAGLAVPLRFVSCERRRCTSSRPRHPAGESGPITAKTEALGGRFFVKFAPALGSSRTERPKKFAVSP